MPPSIFEFIKQQESQFETQEIKVGDNWNWSFRNHVQLIFHLKNGVFYTGSNNWLRAFKNIMEPMINLSNWMEDIELKDVQFFIEGDDNRVASFLLRKYHNEVYAKENNLDEMIDEITESDNTYGGVLIQKTNKPKPEIFELNTIAFCDQTDILGGPIGFKHTFSPSALRKMSKFGWGDTKKGATISIEDLIVLADQTQESAGLKGIKNKTSGKSINTYIVRGDMPEAYLKDNDDMETYTNQIQIVAYYNDKDSKEHGVCLYRMKDDEDNIKFFSSQPVSGRALGRGEGERQLHPQVWSNFLTIHKMNMIEAGAKILPYTDDETFGSKNKLQEKENMELSTIEQGRTIGLIPTLNPNAIQLFDKTIEEWYAQAQLASSAFDPVLGEKQISGTTFRGQERVVQQGRGSHDRKRGKRAKFIEEIYRDYIIPQLKKDILGGTTWLSELSLKDMQYVVDSVTESSFEEYQKNLVLAGQDIPDPQTLQAMKDKFKQDFRKKGNKHILEILKGEFKDAEVKMGISVASKQKDLTNMVDKLMGLFGTITANPYLIKSPPLMELFNEAVELAGLQPIDLSGFDVPPMPTRRMTETIAYADLATPPNDIQKQFLGLAGIQPTEQFQQPQPTK